MGHPEPAVARTLAITGCGVVSPIGIGFADFSEAIAAKRSGATPVDGLFAEAMPQATACMVRDFSARAFLGKKGTSTFDRLTSLVVVTCGLALKDSHLTVTDENRDRVGVTIGTSTGSLKSTSDFTRDTLVQDRPYLVNPALFPNTIFNCSAAQAAIWHSLRGVNATISGGELSSLVALRYASTVIRQGYVDVLLVGAVEEFTPHSAWSFHHAGVLRDTETLVGEGCAVFVVEDAAAAVAAGRRPIAQVLACEMSAYGELGHDACLSHALADNILRALRRTGVRPEQIGLVAGCSTGERALEAAESEGLELALDGRTPRRLAIKEQVGDCYSAAGAMQLAALLSAFGASRNGAEDYGLVTSIGYDGTAGCALLKRWT